MRLTNIFGIKCNLFLPAVFLAGILPGTMAAQTTTTPTTTTTTVQALNIERSLTLSGLESTLTPNIPSATLSGVQSGTNEIRESINYNPQANFLTLNLFTVPAGGPLPTPPGSVAGTTFSTILIKVDNVYTATTPNNSIMFVGTVATNLPASPFGDVTGAPVAVSIGYTNDTPPKITNVVTLIAGTVVAYSASGGGTLTLAGAPVTPPGTSAAIQIVVKVPGATVMNFVGLDASATTGANPPLKFSWTVLSGNATVFNGNNAIASAELFGFGTYIFQVTVTDSKGNVMTSPPVNVTYN